MFFYVDDIVFAFLVERSRIMEAIMAELKKRYNLTGGGDLQWFLGMEIIRDRRGGHAALTQNGHSPDTVVSPRCTPSTVSTPTQQGVDTKET